MQWVFLTWLFVYMTIGLILGIVANCTTDELIIVTLFWPVFVFVTLFVLFFYACFKMGVLVKTRVYRRQRYLERRRKQKQNEKML